MTPTTALKSSPKTTVPRKEQALHLQPWHQPIRRPGSRIKIHLEATGLDLLAQSSASNLRIDAPDPNSYMDGGCPERRAASAGLNSGGAFAGNRNGSTERQESQRRDSSESQGTTEITAEKSTIPTSRKPRPFFPQENLPGTRAAASTAGPRSGETRRDSSAEGGEVQRGGGGWWQSGRSEGRKKWQEEDGSGAYEDSVGEEGRRRTLVGAH